jgi:hypothetical protein
MDRIKKKLKGRLCPKGNKSYTWRGGILKRKGYVFIYCPDHPYSIGNYVRQHRLLMEKHLGRYLEPEEIVHHINGVKDDNRIENLQLFSTQADHMIHHRKHCWPSTNK